MAVLVTGGAGYIGGQFVWLCHDAGIDVVVLDDLSTGNGDLLPDPNALIVGDVGDKNLIGHLAADNDIEAIVHFAGSIIVPESVEQPLKYYDNNTTKSRALIEAALENGIDRFVFSSTAAVYGDPGTPPVSEATPLAPVSPYGRSKLMTEWMLKDVARSSSLRYVALRYFNVAGADPKGRTGQTKADATHLIKVAMQAALGHRSHLSVFGTDYPTPDGTGVRDYIHVADLAQAHLLALTWLREGGASDVFNCGYGAGATVREVIAAVEAITGRPLPISEQPRRPGDPASVVADTSKIEDTLGFAPKYNDLETIIRSALDWERLYSQRNTTQRTSAGA